MPPTDPTTAALPVHAVPGSGVPIALVHGFTQTHVSWRPVADHLPTRPLLLPDLPGHGRAGHDTADLPRAAALLGEAVGRAVYVGYSMGGRVALRLALDRPDLVVALVLVGATAGIDDDGDRRARRRADESLADEIERDGVDPFLDRWLGQPLFAGLAVEPDDLAARRANRPAGLAGSLRHAGTGTMDPPWWDDLGGVDRPVLIVNGSLDAKFDALAERLASSIGPSADRAIVSGAGHAAHLERPDAFAAVLDAYLSGLPDDDGSTGS